MEAELAMTAKASVNDDNAEKTMTTRGPQKGESISPRVLR